MSDDFKVGILSLGMSINEKDVEHLAKLARISLTDQEKKEFIVELPKIVAFVDQLNGLAKGENNEQEKLAVLSDLRADEPKSSGLIINDLEKLAPAWRDNQLEVPAVFGEEHHG